MKMVIMIEEKTKVLILERVFETILLSAQQNFSHSYLFMLKEMYKEFSTGNGSVPVIM